MDRPPTIGQRPTQLHPSAGPEKSCQVFIRDHPQRSIAIVSSSHCLIFRYSSTVSENSSQVSVAGARSRNAGDSAQPRCIVEFSRNTSHVLANYRPLTSQPIFGTLGLTAVDGDVFLCVVTHATRAASLRPAETVERISSVEFYCLNTSAYDDVFSLNTPDAELSDIYAENLARRELSIEQHPCQDLRKVLSNGTFYYSTDFDLTNRLQERPASNASFDIDNFNESFLWNSFMINPLIKFRSRLMPREREALDNSRILTSAIRGFCGTMTIPQAAAPVAPKSSRLPSFLSVISRLSCKRAGTRFNARGIDDDGNVANFVETETVYWSPAGVIFSYVQVRGSLPVFWEQAPDLIPGRQKITVTRSPDGTQPAFNKHFQELEGTYGAVHIVNLLSDAKPGEAELTQLYRYGASHCPLSMPEENRPADHALLRSTEYDFHAETKAMGYEAAKGIRKYIESSIDAFAYYLAQEADDADGGSVSPGKNARLVVVLQQEGVFRTNCLDCLDRTNLIQTMISQMAVEAFLSHRGEYAASDFWMRHSSLWADNGDSLSKIYAGTGALKTSFTRTGKMSLSGAMADFRKSAQRLYHNNFTDPSRQITIDLLLGRLVGQQPVQLFDPISDYVSQELSKRSSEYSTSQAISIYVGTFNLNGRTNGVQEDLSSWLWPESSGSTLPDLVVIGFQEIVELSPQQIMNSDPSRKQLWEQAVKQALNARARKAGQDKYVLLRSGQLVGAALCIFVKSSVLGNIKNVEGSVKKTGMSGMAGNKGAVAIRLDYASTQICFVTAHLAAGFANYDERNRDFATIHDGLRFQRNRGIDDHDTVIWLGDFNYRIGLDRETTISLVQRGDLATLYDNDQLNLQMVAGLAFPYYSESKITFLPTYRYDIGTDEFDSSEKARIPAWTDRILRKGSNIKQLAYGSAPLRFSDHRPVYAVFQCIVNVVDEKVRQSISEDLYRKRKADIGDSSAIIGGDSSDDEDLIGYDAIEPGLPPASSDQQKWWLANGQFARVDMTPPAMGSGRMATVLNPNRPANPFSATDEPDWVSVPRSSSRQSQSSMASSAYEMINNSTVLSTSAGTTPAGRRLPPPYDPGATLAAAKVGRGGGGLDEASGRSTPAQKTVARETPPPPLPRRQASTSASHARPVSVKPLQKTRTAPPPPPSRTVSGGGQKAPAPPPQVAKESKPSAPPVAKKPSYLASASPPHTKITFPAGERTVGEGVVGGSSRPPLPVRSSTGLGSSPLSGSTGAAAAAGSIGRKPIAPPKPPKPAAAVTAAAARKPAPPRGAAGRDGDAVDLLDSLEGDGMGGFSGWETLKPTE